MNISKSTGPEVKERLIPESHMSGKTPKQQSLTISSKWRLFFNRIKTTVNSETNFPLLRYSILLNKVRSSHKMEISRLCLRMVNQLWLDRKSRWESHLSIWLSMLRSLKWLRSCTLVVIMTCILRLVLSQAQSMAVAISKLHLPNRNHRISSTKKDLREVSSLINRTYKVWQPHNHMFQEKTKTSLLLKRITS